MQNPLIALGLLAAFASPVLAHGHKLTMGTEGAYPPYNYVSDDGNIAGFEIELGNDLCARMRADCTWKTNEWDTIIPNLIGGNYDTIMAGMSITDERKKTINFSEEYFPASPSSMAAYSGKSFDFGNLSGVTIGVQGATIQAAYAEENFAAKNIIKSYETGEQSAADLAAGAVDIVLADEGFLKSIVDASGGTLTFVGPEIHIGGGIGIGLRKGDNKLLVSINKAIAEAKADGTVDKLLKKYFDVGPFYN
ncbi:MAG: transporter substrate-binding domain-containing protein [Alphaproteobacteria bacterium]|nr:transporter substrate-binding domain-containing protein [Alphaproteobacteria bacterium]